jgi:hypothetical protein
MNQCKCTTCKPRPKCLCNNPIGVDCVHSVHNPPLCLLIEEKFKNKSFENFHVVKDSKDHFSARIPKSLP